MNLEAPFAELAEAAARKRDRAWGRRITYSPKVFLPLTNLCPDRCGYCSFRRSPGDPGEWTMSPDEVIAWLERGRAQGCSEALFCLGDKPERAWRSYRETLASWGHASTVDYLAWAAEAASARGLMAHTNAGLLDDDELARLKPLNASLGLMLESSNESLAAHQLAPDKRPSKRLDCLRAAGRLRIPMTTGILVGIGESARDRAEALTAINEIHRQHGHIQEVIVQSFRARPGIAMAHHPEPSDLEVAHAIAMARLILDEEVAVQAPPNLNADALGLLLDAGINDFGGISPVTPDYINPRHQWPHVERLRATCAARGFTLAARLPVYERFAS